MATLVTLTVAKAHVRRTDTAEDSIIGVYLAAAIRWVEDYTGHILSEREVVAAFTEFGDYLTIHATPNVVISSIAYTNTDGDIADFAYFAYPSGINPVKIYPDDDWPSIEDNSAILVTYTAGYEADEVPDALNHAVLLLVGHWYANRGAVQEGDFAEVPLAVTSLCRPYRGVVVA
jgi:uncharacterized phiE125 gp8 family phage protein